MGCSPSSQVAADKHNLDNDGKHSTNNQSFVDLTDVCFFNTSRSGSPRSCCSFGQLIEQNENYQIYEYVFQDLIGKGSTTRVFRVKNVETEDTFAAKVYSKSLLTKQILLSGNSAIENIKTEIEIQSRLHSPYIISIIEIIEDEPNDSIIMVMQLAENGNLCQYVKNHNPDEKTICKCFYQIGSAVKYLHEQDVTHRDIKPTNILVINENHFCLADFSCAKKLNSSDEMLLDTKGTPAYLSPEECSGDMFSPKSSDVWAFGLSIYWAIFGFLPFELDTVTGSELANLVFTVSKLLQSKELVIPECSDVVRDLLTLILVKDPTKRPTISEVLCHPWFNQCKEEE